MPPTSAPISSDAGWTVVSGAAYGIDACAHRGAMAMGRPTVAVLACGVDVDYPKSHAALLARIAEEGLVVSEHAPGEPPMKQRFLSRNRIIAGLAAGTVVVEAADRSGSLNTLSWADQLGRVTMGVPGPVTSKASRGVHVSLREGRAILVTAAADVVEELNGLGGQPAPVEVATTEFDRLPAMLRATLDGLDWRTSRSLLELAAVSRLGAREVRDALVVLERQGLASRQGSGWVLARRADTA
ncbi:DNA-processing protein DprA [Aeromicrobium sp. UC242_57]|uniref:DNA-processing protein DprA n=1 Tax=Aeromicrobium sp. UC242_57 TaxID=3374624 RepID=UPI0037BE56BF